MIRPLQKRDKDKILVFTVTNKNAVKHKLTRMKLFKFTFKIVRPYNRRGNIHTVWMRPKRDFVQYLGVICSDGKYRLTKESDLPSYALPNKILRWALDIINNLDRIPPGIEIYFSCFRCSKRLTKKEDIDQGFGANCCKILDKRGQSF